jgi:hypothetical protein
VVLNQECLEGLRQEQVAALRSESLMGFDQKMQQLSPTIETIGQASS